MVLQVVLYNWLIQSLFLIFNLLFIDLSILITDF